MIFIVAVFFGNASHGIMFLLLMQEACCEKKLSSSIRKYCMMGLNSLFLCLLNYSSASFHQSKIRNLFLFYGNVFCYLGRVEKAKRCGEMLFMDSETSLSNTKDPPEANWGEENRHGELRFFDRSTVIAATDNFSLDKKIGEGGFGPVYKLTILCLNGWFKIEEFSFRLSVDISLHLENFLL